MMSITQHRAAAAIAAARRAAQEIGVPMNVAVLDAAAHLKAFLRMDGALLGSIDIALGKAKTAALFGMNTEEVGEFCKPGGTSPDLQLTNGVLVVFAGGIPIRGEDGALLGAVGVSGGAVDHDFRVAQAAAAAAQTPEEEHNRSVIARSFDTWREGTGGPYDLLAEDVSWTITGNSLASRTYLSREAFLSEVIHPFNARMATRLVPTVRHLYAEGNTVVAFFDTSGTARDGKPYANTYAWFLEMRDGRIVKAHAFFDSIAFDDFWRRVTPTTGN
jgi:uncharacterized protein GlcG (DUF336 family)/ketosteroid isomerase-like protein